MDVSGVFASTSVILPLGAGLSPLKPGVKAGLLLVGTIRLVLHHEQMFSSSFS